MNMRTYLVILVLASLCLAGAEATTCSCSPLLCCSQDGKCGITDEFCGAGCQAGPCYPPSPPAESSSLEAIVTSEFFNSLFNQSNEDCTGRSFYSRDAFLNATSIYFPLLFFDVGYSNESKRELAAFFAHATYETQHFCNIEEVGGESKDYCNPIYTEWPCVDGKKYYGRGALQLSWNYNYGPAGVNIGFDGLGYPETVATDPTASFGTSLWYWETEVGSVVSDGFGATIRAIAENECDGGKPYAVHARVGYYLDYCKQFGVDPGTNLYC